jgi:hypothetical protein
MKFFLKKERKKKPEKLGKKSVPRINRTIRMNDRCDPENKLRIYREVLKNRAFFD